MPKSVAKTLTTILEDSRIKQIQDLSHPIKELADKVVASWSMDLFTRKPGPAYDEDGVFVGTDLDLACFMTALSERNAVIVLPKYKGRTQAKKTAGEQIVSKDNRHGQILNVTAHKELFSFSIKIKDMNVIVGDGSEVGAYRNFMLVDYDGSWYDGWQSIQFVPSADENSFLNDNNLWSGASVIFKNFVHPNRWGSFYGRPYFVTKALIARLENEVKHLKGCIDSLKAEGINYPERGEGAKKEWPESEKVGDAKSVKFRAFEAEVDLPEPIGAFAGYNDITQDELVRLTDLRSNFVYKILPRLRFAARATELAFFKHGLLANGSEEEKMPAWIKNAKWERDFVVEGKRKKWNRLVLTQPGVGEWGIALRYRLFDKSQKVAVE